MTVILKTEHLNGGYQSNAILNDICIEVPEQSFISICGPNGSGKSTLLKYFIKELKAEENTIFINGDDIKNTSYKNNSYNIAFTSQNPNLNYEFTVNDLLAMGNYQHTNNTEKIDLILNELGLYDIKDKKVNEISGGELQLAMAGRMIVQNSKIFALDEPLNNLDPKHQFILLNLLKKYIRFNNKTVLCVLHDLNSALKYSDYVILMKNGKVYKYGKPIEILTEENIKYIYETDCRIISKDNERIISFN